MTDPKEYGKALYLLSKEEGREDSISKDVSTVLSALSMNPDYTKLLDTPALTKEERVRLCDEAFSGCDEYLLNTMKLLVEKRAAHLIPAALSGFSLAYDEDKGIERVEAVSAVAMTEAQISALTHKLEEETGKQIIISNTVDPTILGGVVLRYMGVQLDGSLKTRLEGFKKSLDRIIV